MKLNAVQRMRLDMIRSFDQKFAGLVGGEGLMGVLVAAAVGSQTYRLKTGAITAEEATDPSYYARHLRGAVQFAQCLEELFRQPERVLLEVGPGQTLTALARRHPARPRTQVAVPAMRRPADDVAEIDQHPLSVFVTLDAQGHMTRLLGALNHTVGDRTHVRPVAFLPRRIAGARRHARRHGQHFVQIGDLAGEPFEFDGSGGRFPGVVG